MQLDPNRLLHIIQESPLTYKESGGSWVFTCPKCNKRDKLYIRRSDGRFICFYCADRNGFCGKPEYALAALLDWSLQDVRKELYGKNCGLDVDLPDIREYDSPIIPDTIDIYEPLEWPHNFYPLSHLFSIKGKSYLTQTRGVPLEILDQYDIRYCPATQRVYFPLHKDGVLYGWQGRIIHNQPYWDDKTRQHRPPLKILSSKALPRDFTMFYDNLHDSKHAIVCEGPLDALKAHLCGGNIATMGKIVTQTQLNAILALGIKDIYLALDPDATQEITHLLRNNIGVTFYNMIAPAPYKDLGEMSPQAVLELFNKAEPMVSTKFYAYIKPPGFIQC